MLKDTRDEHRGSKLNGRAVCEQRQCGAGTAACLCFVSRGVSRELESPTDHHDHQGKDNTKRVRVHVVECLSWSWLLRYCVTISRRD